MIPQTVWVGALGGIGDIAGAIMAHLTILGIEVLGDVGTLFFLALAVLVCSLSVLYLHRNDLQHFLNERIGSKVGFNAFLKVWT